MDCVSCCAALVQHCLGIAGKKRAKSAPKLSAWKEANGVESLTVFALSAAHHRNPRITNMLERINKGIRRGTRMATLFHNESLLLRPVSALLPGPTQGSETENG